MSKRKPRPRQRGTGRIWLPEGRTVYMMKYHLNGETVRKSTGERDPLLAEQALARAIGKVNLGIHASIDATKVMMDELFERLEGDYEANDQTSFADVRTRWTLHIAPVFGGRRAVEVTYDSLISYRDQRLAEGASRGTVRVEYAAIKRMLRLGRKSCSSLPVPEFPIIKPGKKREGYFEDDQYHRMVDGKPLWFRSAICFGRTNGWRHEEVMALRVRHLHLPSRRVRLEAGAAKNDEARIGVITDELYQLLKLCCHGKKPSDYVFTQDDGQRAYMRVPWYRAACEADLGAMYCLNCKKELEPEHGDDWWQHLAPLALTENGERPTCERCGQRVYLRHETYHGLIFHDLRRTANRTLQRLGLARKTIQKIIGWKTPAMIDYYSIDDDSEYDSAIEKLSAVERRSRETYEREKLPDGHTTGTRDGFDDLEADLKKLQ
jgi:hypothetical protein